MFRSASSAIEVNHRLITNLDSWLQESQVATNVKHRYEQDCELVFDLEKAVYTRDWQQLAPEVGVRLDRLRKKIEVAKKLYRYYLLNLSRPFTFELLSPLAVERLVVILLKAAIVWRDVRYLNSALKLVDGVLERDDCIFQEDVRALVISTLDTMAPLNT